MQVELINNNIINMYAIDIPEKLYNYMSIEKLLKVVKSDTWIFGNLDEMNDYKERKTKYIQFSEDEILKLHYSCFSKYNNISPMWYFYGDKYKGVCIEFLSKDLNSRYKIEFTPIKYLNFTDPKSWHVNNHNLREYLSNKLSCWEYEQEVRMFYTGDDNSLNNITNVISRIFLGPDFDIESLKQYVLLKNFLRSFYEEGKLVEMQGVGDGRIIPKHSVISENLQKALG